jgi:glycosyltransferase involved in cell wall biosynthesis
VPAFPLPDEVPVEHAHVRRDRPHVLLVAFYFPPARASGVFRARAIANHLVARGWDVTVLAADAWFFTEILRQSDASLMASIDPRVSIERVEFTGRRLDRDLRRHGRFRGNFPKPADRWLERSEQRIFPDAYAPWIRPATSAGLAVARRRGVDLVLATGNPFSSFEVARRIATRGSVPYVLDYRDAWSLDQFGEVPAYPDESPVWASERTVLENAARVVFVNHAQRRWYAERYPQVAARMRVVENGWDPELLSGEAEQDVPSSGIRMGYIGTITRHLPWATLFDAWDLIRRDPDLLDVSIDLYGYLGFFAHGGSALHDLLPDAREARVTYHGPLPKDQVGLTYRGLDVLLLVTPSSRYVTCQKVYEYMAFAKPIVSVNDPGTDARTPVKGYPLAFNAEQLTAGEVARQMRFAVAAARTSSPTHIEQAREHAAQYERSRRLEVLEHELQGLLDG